MRYLKLKKAMQSKYMSALVYCCVLESEIMETIMNAGCQHTY
jgi:hypothetical protein